MPREYAREHQGLYYNRESFPLQSCIAWMNTSDGPVKEYYHNIGDTNVDKDSAYSRKIFKYRF